MKRSIIFIKAGLLLMLACLLTPKATACGWDLTDNYYLFYAFKGDRTNRELIRTQLTEWWTRYAGKMVTTDDLDALAEEVPTRMNQSKNPIVRAAYSKNDRPMQQYLALLCEYLSVVPSGEYDPWSYPDEEELAMTRRALLEIANRAARIQATRYAPQIALLRIRALFQAERWQDVVKLYQQTVKTLPESVFKDMASGFYAGALRKLGSDEDAAEIYASLGDFHSATWCVHDGRNLGTIRRLYSRDPNSAVVRLLVQDFVNNAQETLDNSDGDNRLGHNGYISRVYANEVAQFALLAQQAAANPAVEDPCMWLTAAAWSTYLYGNREEGKALIDQAMTANYKDMSKDIARMIRIVIYSGVEEDLESFDNFVLPELKWLTERIAYSEEEGFSPFFNAAQRIYRRHLAPLYQAHGRSTDARLCIAEAERLYSIGGAETLRPYQVLYGWEYASDLLYQDSETLLALYADLTNENKRPLTEWLYEQLHPALKQADFYADLIGTRLMKEGKFEKALPWLEKVSLNFLSAQDISYYMARRDYTRERWITARQTLPEVRNGFGGEVPTRLQTNQRLTFCRDIIALQNKLQNTATPNEKAKTHYQIATRLFQASLQGDCWYLTEYYRQSDPPSVLLDTLAYDHLTASAQLALETKEKDLYTRCLFAKAYINLDAKDWNSYSFFNYNYDWQTERYTLAFFPDNQHQQSRDYFTLASHVRSLPSNERPTYLKRCDVLTTWLARNP